MSAMRVAVMGSGALGCFFGGLLARAGEDVVFIARGANLREIRRSGLTVKVLPAGAFHLDVRATDDPGGVGPVDLVLCCVKSYDLGVAAPQMGPLVGSDTVVLPIQNCIDAAERIAAVVGAQFVIGGVCRGGAALEEPGVVAQKTVKVELLFGELAGGQSSRTVALLQRLERAGFDAALHSDIRVAIWEKFIGVCGTHALCAATRLPLGSLMELQETRDLMEGMMREAEEVGGAAGVQLPKGCAESVFAVYEERALANPGVYPSLYYDLVAGRRLELEDTNGAVVRLGHTVGVRTPLNFAIYAMLKPYVAGGIPPGL